VYKEGKGHSYLKPV